MKTFFMLVGIVVCTTTTAQDKSNDTTARYFIIQASIGNQQEIAMGKLAIEKAVRPDVKAFAQRMVSDHTKAQEQLVALINLRGYPIPREATEAPPENMRLRTTPPKDFDWMYVHMMEADHRQTIQLFEKYTRTGKDPDANVFAKQTLPVLKEHLAAIIAIDHSIGDTGK